MSTIQSTATGNYVYAIVRSQDADDITKTALVGLNDETISAVKIDQIAAITTNIAVEKIRPRRQLLAAHQNIVTAVARQWDMLPVSFGLIADSRDDLIRILENNSDVLAVQLDRIGGQVEMNVILRWASESVFKLFVDRHPELQEARDYIASGQATRDDMIELGRQFEQLLARERASHQEIVMNPLEAICSEIEPQSAQGEQEVVRLNCLLPRESVDAFNDAVHQLAAKYDEQYAFNLSGPWPPYSFVNLALSAE